jgi:UDP:flavonoid glycosyltransferase YjiC (YdhE family)
MVPVDRSDFSHFAAEQAARVAQAYAAEVIVVHVVDEQVVEELAQEGNHERAQQVREQLRENGQIYLRDAARCADTCQVAHRELIAAGDPCAVIGDAFFMLLALPSSRLPCAGDASTVPPLNMRHKQKPMLGRIAELGYRTYYAHFLDGDLTVIVLMARDYHYSLFLDLVVLPIVDVYLPGAGLPEQLP